MLLHIGLGIEPCFRAEGLRDPPHGIKLFRRDAHRGIVRPLLRFHLKKALGLKRPIIFHNIRDDTGAKIGQLLPLRPLQDLFDEPEPIAIVLIGLLFGLGTALRIPGPRGALHLNDELQEHTEDGVFLLARLGGTQGGKRLLGVRIAHIEDPIVLRDPIRQHHVGFEAIRGAAGLDRGEIPPIAEAFLQDWIQRF